MTEVGNREPVVLSRLCCVLYERAERRRAATCFLIPFFCFLLAACGQKEQPAYQEQGYVFGTLVEVSVHGEDEGKARKAVASVMQEFQRLHNLLHAWEPSAVSGLNAAFGRGASGEVPPELAAMLKDAAQLSAQSGNLFNPAIGGLVKLWGFHADEFHAALPDEKQLAALVAARPQMSDIVFLTSPPQAGRTVALPPSGGKLEGGNAGVVVTSRNPAVQLDLGGYAKGYALDRAALLMKQQGIRNALINIGGNVLALGRHGDRAWRIGIQHPRKPGPIATMELHDGEAVGTSGDYQRYFMLGDKRYCHLIDPRSGQPVQGVQAVTVLIKPPAIRPGEQTTPVKPAPGAVEGSPVMARGARAGVLSDAVSKPLFISGSRGWRSAAQKMNIAEALLIDGEGVVHVTAAMRKRLEFTDKTTVLKAGP
ncbi:MAG: FAD:protein FMN transferase [Nitrosomonadales bacterium]|nr:FAD:protein FMN transferase [Nitrosomonadales bacterium]